MMSLRFSLPLVSLLAGVLMQGQSHAPEATLKLEAYRTRWVLPATVGGHARRFLLDTAGGLTLISRTTATDAGCVPWGRLTGFTMFAKRGDSERCDNIEMEIDKSHFRLPIAGLVDMGKLNPRDAELDGIISLNLFEGRAITLELDKGLLTIESAESLKERVASMTPVAVSLSREVQGHSLSVSVAVPSKKGVLWMELDSGNGGTVLVSKQVSALVGLIPDSDERQDADFAIVKDVRVITKDAFTPDLIIDGNLGMPFLKTCRVTLDLKNGKGWLAPVVPAH